MDDFRADVLNVVVCTDALTRGIDVPEVAMVVEYDLPFLFGSNKGANNVLVCVVCCALWCGVQCNAVFD